MLKPSIATATRHRSGASAANAAPRSPSRHRPPARRGDLAHAHPRPTLRSGRRHVASGRTLTAHHRDAPPKRDTHTTWSTRDEAIESCVTLGTTTPVADHDHRDPSKSLDNPPLLHREANSTTASGSGLDCFGVGCVSRGPRPRRRSRPLPAGSSTACQLPARHLTGTRSPGGRHRVAAWGKVPVWVV